MSNAADGPAKSWLRSRARVAEAMVLLAVARLLIGLVPLRLWRRTLGRMTHSAKPSPDANLPPIRVRRVVRAVDRAAQRLPFVVVCLPRAMAVQWMLRRRRLASALVFGILPSQQRGDIHALHAWVEVGGRIVIGDDPERHYHRGLVIAQGGGEAR